MRLIKNILVTGGSGFIGKYLMDALKAEGYKPFNFDITENKKHSILDRGAITQAIKENEIDVVFHLAAEANLNWSAESLENTEKTLELNIEGTTQVALACQECDVRLIYISTCCVYGHQTEHPTTEDKLPHPAEIYAQSKLAGEHVIEGISQSWGLEYNIARIATVYGYGQRPALGSFIFMNQAFKGEPITVHGTGEQERTITHVEDIVSGLIAILSLGKKNEIYNVSTEEVVTALEMANIIKTTCESESEIQHIQQRANQVFHERISHEKLTNDTLWKPRYRFREGIAETIKHYREEYEKNTNK